jgi:3-methylcrotonyl-CoA carboxylase alpha subunit
VIVNGKARQIRIAWQPDAPGIDAGLGDAKVGPSTETHVVTHEGRVYALRNLVQTVVAWPSWNGEGAGAREEAGGVRAPITGRITKLFIAEGARLAKGDRVGIVEAMKMEHVLHAARAGAVKKVLVREGEIVAGGALIAELSPEEAE